MGQLGSRCPGVPSQSNTGSINNQNQKQIQNQNVMSRDMNTITIPGIDIKTLEQIKSERSIDTF